MYENGLKEKNTVLFILKVIISWEILKALQRQVFN